MSIEAASRRRANFIGSLWMIMAMAAFAIEDALLKAVSDVVPVGQTLMFFGVGGSIVFAGWALVRRDPLFRPEVLSRPMLFRVVFEILGRLFYILAITLTPLSSATVILQATPIVVVAGAALIFGEQVGWRRWLAIGVGLAGVFVIIQPGSNSFSVLSILAVLGMLGFAGRDLASRAAPSVLSTSILGLYGFLSVIAAGMIILLWQGTELVAPDPASTFYLTCAVLVGVIAYSGLMKAMRTGDVSAVTPFRYTRLLFGIGLGVMWFNETLSFSMMLGCGLIVASGLFILWRGQQVKDNS
ncbi:MAG: DMT family transporter [Pseudomonadota bacterium]